MNQLNHLPHDGPIPGERDPHNLTHRQPGAASGQFAGADIPQADHLEWMDDKTVVDRLHEGGGSNARHMRKDR